MTRPVKHTRAAFAFMAVLFLLLVILDSLVFLWEREVLMENSYNETQNELELIGTFLTEPLVMHEFTMVEQFMIHWGEIKKDVVSLRAFSPDGSLLAEYKNPSKSAKTFIKNHSVDFFEQHLLDLELSRFIHLFAKINKII